MVIYVEYALAENFLLDALLLYLALRCARGNIRVLNLLVASAAGAAMAVVFPILSLPTWCAYLVKILGGLLIVVIAVSKGTKKTYLFTTIAFFFLTFALGGLLTAAYSFFNVEYAEGSGYLVEKAPVGLILGGAGVFFVAAFECTRRFYRYKKVKTALFDCTLTHREKTVHWRGFADSGNCLEYRGSPVCVISATAAFALFGRNLIEAGRIRIGTVNGGRESPLLLCERLELGGIVHENVLFAVGEVNAKEYQIILHTALVEGEHETAERFEELVGKDTRKRKRRTLSLRK